MSMSQEEIESLMNGLDFDDNAEPSETAVEESETQVNMSEDDINELIAQTEDIASTEPVKENETVDDILNNLENIEVEDADSQEETNIDDILKELEKSEPVKNEVSTEDDNIEEIAEEKVLEKEIEELSPEELIIDEPTIEEKIAVSNEKISKNNIDELLSTIEGVSEDEPTVEVNSVVEDIPVKEEAKENINHKIDTGIFPLPVEEDTKVVNQLNEVANDTEEKATKIFDVLSNILDYNNVIQDDIKALNEFNEKQVAMLASLSKKFPNIAAFNENLEQAEKMGTFITDANSNINESNTEIFQAMELMQYHDINRQKIERVMSVIRKLSSYLNNLFEDDDNRAEVVVANHIHGDNTDDLVNDEDLETLISEFNK